MKVHFPKLYNMAQLSLNVFTASKGSNNYILFIKKYIDRDSDSSVISSVSMVNSVPHEQNQTDFEEMNSVNCEPLSSKLQNSDIVHDLDQKLVTSRSGQEHVVKQLILE